MLFTFLSTVEDFFPELITCSLLSSLRLGNGPSVSSKRPPAHLPSQMILSKHWLLTPRELNLTFVTTTFLNKCLSKKGGENEEGFRRKTT